MRGATAPAWPGESRPLVLGELLAEVAASWEPVAAAQGRFVCVEAGAGAGAIVRGDPERLAQALGNLVANALEHGAGAVHVGVGRRPDGVALRRSATPVWDCPPPSRRTWAAPAPAGEPGAAAWR